MPFRARPAVLWTLATRTLLPTYGARANAADALRDTRRTTSDRQRVERALDASGRTPSQRAGR